MKKQVATIHIKEGKEALVRHIESMICRIPPSFNNWSHQTSVEFKEVVAEANKYVKRKRVTMPQLSIISQRLSVFWN